MLKTVKCTHCGKVLLEANGEVKKICPSCGEVTWVCVTSIGIINLNKRNKAIKETVIK